DGFGTSKAARVGPKGNPVFAVLLTWALAVVYWSISIVDHVGNFVTTTTVGPPSIAEGMSNPYLVPAIQTALDIVFIALLFVPRYRDLFFRVAHTTD
nr:hypothetical protein [Deltaproteobacteria bacterium]